MSIPRPISLLALHATLLAAPAASQCLGGTSPCHVVSGSADVADGLGPVPGPWQSGHTYIVPGSINVPAGQTLTIEPGAIVKFDGDLTQMFVYGTLDARGTAAQPIVFTSYRDDSAGGDHNGDGGATTPVKSDWLSLYIVWNSVGTVLEHCEVRYAGKYGSAGVITQGSGVTLRNLTISDCSWAALDMNEQVPTAIENCRFDDSDEAVIKVAAAAVTKLSGNQASGNSGGDSLSLSESNDQNLTSSATWTTGNTLNGGGVIRSPRDLTVTSNATLTLGPGVVLKWAPSSGLLVSTGSLHAIGTASAPVVMTSLADDDHGGDSLNDGPTSGASGDWEGVWLASGSSGNQLTNLVVRYAGDATAGLRCYGAATSLVDCTVEASSADGLFFNQADTTVDGCLFLDNGGYPISPVPITMLSNLTGNDASGNGAGDLMLLGGGSLSQPLTLNPDSAFNGSKTFGLSSTVTIATSGSLTVLPGVIVKADPATKPRITVNGTLVCDAGGGDPISFTSLYDDTIGGDSNNDGGATTPTPGDWRGFYFGYQSDASALRNVVVRYGGNATSAAIVLDSADIPVDGSRIERSASDGMSCYNSAPTVVGCDFDDNDGSPVTEANLESVASFSNNNASGNGGGDVLRVVGSGLSADTTILAANAFNQSGVFVVEGSLSTAGGAGSLTLGPGVIFKFEDSGGVNVGPPLVCNGTGGAPVVFTSIHDDAKGGDSAGDGATSGSPGEWIGLNFYLDQGSVLDGVEVRFAGQGGVAAIRTAFGAPSFTGCTVEYAEGVGLDLSGGDATVTGCTFRACTFPIDRAPLTGLPLLSGNLAIDSTLGDVVRVNRVGSLGPVQVDAANGVNGNGIFVVTGDLNTGAALDVGPGVVFKFSGPRRLTLNQPLNALGEVGAEVVFTSVHDPEYGPEYFDASSPPAPGDWIGLLFSSSGAGSLVQDARIRYAGAHGEAAVELQSSSATFCRVVIERNAGHGIDTNENSTISLKDCQIDDNGGKAIQGLTWPVLGNMSGTTATGNGINDGATVIESPFVQGHLTIEQGSYFGECIVVMVTPNTSPDDTLSFGRGVVIKAGAPNLFMPVARVDGTGLEKVVFTSIHDDEHGGDTNGDGGAMLPLPGDWLGVFVSAPVPEVDDPGMRHALIRYGGGGPIQWSQTASDNGALVSYSGTIESTRVEYSADIGANLDPIAPAFGANADTVVVYANAGTGLIAGIVTNCTAAGNGGYGIDADTARYCISWDNGVGGAQNYSYSADQVMGPFGTNVVWSCGTSLSVGPGTGYMGNCGATGWGNIDQDPRFVDPANGDLRLAGDSPCRNYAIASCPSYILQDPEICKPWGPTGHGYSEPPASARDYFEFPRSLDDDLSGPAPRRADLGAHERALHELEPALGQPKIGTTVALLVHGSPATAIYVAGADGETYLPGFGWILLDPLQHSQVIGIGAVGALQPAPIPLNPNLIGKEFSVEALILPPVPDTVINPTNVWRPRILP